MKISLKLCLINENRSLFWDKRKFLKSKKKYQDALFKCAVLIRGEEYAGMWTYFGVNFREDNKRIEL
jgi:hypothetical protein